MKLIIELSNGSTTVLTNVTAARIDEVIDNLTAGNWQRCGASGRTVINPRHVVRLTAK